MAWFPLGPDAVFGPRDVNYLRLSRRNEVASQGAVASIAIVNAQTLYAVVRPDSSGTSVWRSDNDGESWVSLFDDVHRGSAPETGTWAVSEEMSPAST